MSSMLKVFTGYRANKNQQEHQPLVPCVKLVCGQRVVSLVDRALGFSSGFEVSDLLRVSRVDDVRCFIITMTEDPEDPNLLWDADKFEVEQDSLKTPLLALHWLLGLTD